MKPDLIFQAKYFILRQARILGLAAFVALMTYV
jgi:hypothetical protein